MGAGIFIFETGWGRDEILLSPDELHTVIDTGKIVDYDGSYPYRFRSFFVFGKGIKSEDMRWRGDTLVNIKTGDSIKTNTKNVNLLFADEPMPKFEAKFVKREVAPRDVNLTEIVANDVLTQGEFMFVASETDGISIAKTSADKNATTILSRL